VGLTVVRDGKTVGTVSRVDHFPAQDLLVVATDNGEVMVPFVSEIVPAVDIAAKTVTVTPPGGLFEELDDDVEGPDDADGEDDTDDEDVAIGQKVADDAD
jgi:16S rRNA processing protein RimM